MLNQGTHQTGVDPVAPVAYTLSQIVDGEAFADYQSWAVTVPHQQRRIVISAIDGEWDAGVEIHIFNRSGVVIGRAVLQVMGASARFVAETAAALNREIR
jgi:hypothetical protein